MPTSICISSERSPPCMCRKFAPCWKNSSPAKNERINTRSIYARSARRADRSPQHGVRRRPSGYSPALPTKNLRRGDCHRVTFIDQASRIGETTKGVCWSDIVEGSLSGKTIFYPRSRSLASKTPSSSRYLCILWTKRSASSTSRNDASASIESVAS